MTPYFAAGPLIPEIRQNGMSTRNGAEVRSFIQERRVLGIEEHGLPSALAKSLVQDTRTHGPVSWTPEQNTRQDRSDSGL